MVFIIIINYYWHHYTKLRAANWAEALPLGGILSLSLKVKQGISTFLIQDWDVVRWESGAMFGGFLN